jgi:hypothetical protein
MQKSVAVIIGVFFVVGLSVLAFALKPQKYEGERYISVTGSASKIVEAGGLLWSLEIVNSGNNLNNVLEKNEKDKETLKKFFVGAGINESDIGFEDIQVLNAKENSDGYNAQTAGKDFSSSQSVIIQSTDIKAVKNAQSKLSELFKQGVTLKYRYNKGDTYFKYIYKTSYEQDLLEEAVADAKAAAQKIAERSNVTLGDVYTISLEGVYDSDYSNNYLPSKQVTVRVFVSYSLKK